MESRLSNLIGDRLINKTYFLFWGSEKYVRVAIDNGVESFILKGSKYKNIFPTIFHRLIKIEEG